MERIVSIKSRLKKVRKSVNFAYGPRGLALDVVSRSLELLRSFDEERIRRQLEAGKAKDRLDVVRQDSAERGQADAGKVHEEALVAACRLWEASAVEGISKRVGIVDRIKVEVARVEKADVSTLSEQERRDALDLSVDVEYRKTSVAKFTETEQWSKDVKTERVRVQGGRQGGIPGGKQEGIPGSKQGGIPGGKQGGRPGGKQGGMPGSKQGGMPGESDQQVNIEQRLGVSVSKAATDIQVQSGVEATPVVAPPKVTTVSATSVVTSYFAMDDVDATGEIAFDSGSRGAKDAVDASIVCDATVVSDLVARPVNNLKTRNMSTERVEKSGNSLSTKTAGVASDESSIEVVLDQTQPFVDIEAEVEDDLSDPTRVGLKVLDVIALLIEKVFFIGLPALVSGGSLVWERVDNAINGAKGRGGWELHKGLKKDYI